MKRNSMWGSLLTILVVTVIAAVSLGLGARPKFGLDLQGGISAIYTPVFEDGQPDNVDEVLTQTIGIIRQRIDSLGVAEPEISRLGGDIQVQLPGITDADRANEIIGRTAQLGFYPVAQQLLPGQPGYNDSAPCIVQIPGTDDDPEFTLSPDRPTPDEGVVCGAELLPGLTPEELESLVPEAPASDGAGDQATDGATDPSSDTPASTDSAAPDDPAATSTPDGASTESAVLRGSDDGPATVVAAQEDVSQAPSPSDTATPTDPASPTPSPAPSDVDLGSIDMGDGLPISAPRPYKYLVDPPPAVDGDELTGADIEDAVPGLLGQNYGVTLEFDEDGSDAFALGTSEAACDRDNPSAGRPGLLAIVLDDAVESAPTMSEDVACGVGIENNASISTGSAEGAEDLAVVLNAGSLPLTLQPTTFNTVSPTLGASSLNSGLVAGMVGLVLVALYLLWFYRGLGLIALGALGVFGALVMGAITLMGRYGFALTLAGVAGIIVSVGITADSSIIYFERIRDEVSVGKTTRLAVARGFDSAFRTNLAGNTVTLVAAVILYALAVGPVRGFAFTLGLATLLDLFIMWFYTRSVVGLLAFRGKLGPSIRRRQAADVPSPGTIPGGAR